VCHLPGASFFCIFSVIFQRRCRYERNNITQTRRFADVNPVIFFNLVMQNISGFLVFTQVFIVTGGTPLDTTLFYSLYLYAGRFKCVPDGL
jgi:hypothetical protein